MIVIAGPSPTRVTGVASSSGGRGVSSQVLPSRAIAASGSVR